mmetsp:Transcript_24982/g.79360  ORF Transcript_24982/g.79360 Transcript_24982/m.79360 type:complete len:264 (-) Transcript_24982:22-813(-)
MNHRNVVCATSDNPERVFVLPSCLEEAQEGLLPVAVGDAGADDIRADIPFPFQGQGQGLYGLPLLELGCRHSSDVVLALQHRWPLWRLRWLLLGHGRCRRLLSRWFGARSWGRHRGASSSRVGLGDVVLSMRPGVWDDLEVPLSPGPDAHGGHEDEDHVLRQLGDVEGSEHQLQLLQIGVVQVVDDQVAGGHGLQQLADLNARNDLLHHGRDQPLMAPFLRAHDGVAQLHKFRADRTGQEAVHIVDEDAHGAGLRWGGSTQPF